MRTVLVLTMVACTKKAPPEPAAQPVEPVEAAPADAIAPPPFTAAEIRDGCPAGRTVTFRIEDANLGPRLSKLTFVSVNPDTATFESREWAAGDDAPEPTEMTSTWEELRLHASFPAAITTMSDATIEVPAGTFDTTLYETREGDDLSLRAWFAKDMPGPPVRMELYEGEATVFSITMISNQMPEGGNDG